MVEAIQKSEYMHREIERSPFPNETPFYLFIHLNTHERGSFFSKEEEKNEKHYKFVG